MFITFEGGEGSGKSTQCKLLQQYFLDQKKNTILTREPGGCASAELIRNLLVQGDGAKWIPKTEILLHLAARSEHLANVIKPALDNGSIVISDRFLDSTIAYQGYGHGLSLNYIEQLHNLVLGNFRPDITFILDIDIDSGLNRAHKRNDNENRYENMDKSFHSRLREGFLQIAANNPYRYKVIDASDSIEQIHSQIIEHIVKYKD